MIKPWTASVYGLGKPSMIQQVDDCLQGEGAKNHIWHRPFATAQHHTANHTGGNGLHFHPFTNRHIHAAIPADHDPTDNRKDAQKTKAHHPDQPDPDAGKLAGSHIIADRQYLLSKICAVENEIGDDRENDQNDQGIWDSAEQGNIFDIIAAKHAPVIGQVSSVARRQPNTGRLRGPSHHSQGGDEGWNLQVTHHQPFTSPISIPIPKHDQDMRKCVGRIIRRAISS